VDLKKKGYYFLKVVCAKVLKFWVLEYFSTFSLITFKK